MAKHKFQKNDPRRGPGRAKGQQNKLTRDLKEAIMMAAEMVGRDGKGKEGAAGYLAWLAKNEPQVFGMLLGKLLPMQVTGVGGGPLKVEYSSKDALLEAFKARGLPPPKTLMLDQPMKIIEHEDDKAA